jgi:transposase
MLPASVRIFVCTTPQDMRRSFDRLALAAQEFAGEDPLSGALFVFVSRSSRRVKVLWWDQNGYCLLYKRLHQAVFEIPLSPDGRRAVRIDGAQLARILAGIAGKARRAT